MTLYQLGTLTVLTADTSDSSEITVTAHRQVDETHLTAARDALTPWHPTSGPDRVNAFVPASAREDALDALTDALPPLYGAALRRARALHLADVATEDALELVRAGDISKSEAARVLDVTRQTIDRWLGEWQRS